MTVPQFAPTLFSKAILLLLLSISATLLGNAQQLGVDVVLEENVMIPSFDGIKLATDIYRPAKNGIPTKEKLPLLLQRTPYGKSADRFTPLALYFASNGYVVAMQDLRGRYASEGKFSKYSSLEGKDGAATVEYLAKLPYVNGSVAMFGTSYGAHTQADASKLNPKGLAAAILNMGGMTNAWDHAVRQNGAFELGRELTWAFKQVPAEVDDPVVKAHFEKEKITDWYTAWPFRNGLNPLSIAPNFETYILDEATHADYGEFWQKMGINWVEYFEQTADIPMLHIGGWYDIFLRGTIQNFEELQKLQTSPKWLIIGPWTHGGNYKTFAGDVSFGADAAIQDFYKSYHLEWFDYLLKNKSPQEISTSPVQLFIMGTGDGTKDTEGRLQHGGFWMNMDNWPPKEAKATHFYIREDGSLSNSPSTKENSSSTFTFDPNHPVPTLGGNVSTRVKDGAYDQRERPDFHGSRPPFLPLKARQDILVFQTEPLEEDLQIIGPVKVKLYVSSTAVDTDFTVKLLDIYPPSKDFPSGFDLNLTDGITRMSYRNGRKTRSLIEPNEVYEIELELFPTANVFKKRHRIRVDISSSNFPRWDVNPNTGEPLGEHRRVQKADNTVYHNSTQSSYISLSVVPIDP